MFKLLLLILLSFSLFAKTPHVYSALGDVIYNNSSNIETLYYIEEYATYKEKIEQYTLDVNTTKNDGFQIDSGDKTVDKKKYLLSLRKLSKVNDFFTKDAKMHFKESMEQNNHLLFIKLVNSGLIDTNKYKDTILTYYFDNKEDINASGIIQEYLDADQALVDAHERQRRLRKTKAMLEKEKIQRIRSKDKLEQEKLEKKLNKELILKKLEIRKTQKDELFN